MKKTILLALLIWQLLGTIAFVDAPDASVYTMTNPLDGELVITSDFGWRIHPISGTQKFHSGLDLDANDYQPVYATANGVVTAAGNAGDGYGNKVVIDHGGGIETLYAHNWEVDVQPG